MSGSRPYQLLDDLGDALAEDFRNEEPAVEEDGVGRRGVGRSEKRGEMARDGGVGDVGKAKLAE